MRQYLMRRADQDTAEEALNETLLVCWRRLDSVPAGAEVPWAIGVARGVLANARRAGRRRRRLLERIISVDPPRRGQSELADYSSPATHQVHQAIAQLTFSDAEIVRLWAWEELQPSDIAIALGITSNAATVRLHRAKKRLRVHLQALAAPPTDDAHGYGHQVWHGTVQDTTHSKGETT